MAAVARWVREFSAIASRVRADDPPRKKIQLAVITPGAPPGVIILGMHRFEQAS